MIAYRDNNSLFMFPSLDEPLLLASVQLELLVLGVHSGSLHLLSSASRPVFSLDYLWAQQRVYWLSPDYQSIRWADMKNSNSKGTLIKGMAVSGTLQLRFNKVFDFKHPGKISLSSDSKVKSRHRSKVWFHRGGLGWSEPVLGGWIAGSDSGCEAQWYHSEISGLHCGPGWRSGAANRIGPAAT